MIHFIIKDESSAIKVVAFNKMAEEFNRKIQFNKCYEIENLIVQATNPKYSKDAFKLKAYFKASLKPTKSKLNENLNFQTIKQIKENRNDSADLIAFIKFINTEKSNRLQTTNSYINYLN